MQWPQPKGNKLSRVLIHVETDVHTFSFTEDHLLHIEVNPESEEEKLPEVVRENALIPGSDVFHVAELAALREVLDRIDQLAS